MRELRFRAWHKKLNEWYGESSPDILTFKGFAIFGECTLLCTPRCEDLQYLEITQYTGLKDSKGVEIYEGDILQTQESYTWKVGYCRGGFVAEHPTEPLDFILLDDDDFKVIGNIYENGDLLK